MIDTGGDSSTGAVRTEPVQQRSADRLTRILDAAGEIVDELGLDRITTAMIADRAGASIGTVYRYFPDRVAVLQALRERALARFRARVVEHMIENSPQNWWDAVDYCVTVLAELYRTEPGFRVIHFIDRERIPLEDVEAIEAGFFAHRLAGLLAEDFGLPGGPELVFRLEVMVETADALVSRAFQMDPKGDERFISECRRVVYDYLFALYGPAQQASPAA